MRPSKSFTRGTCALYVPKHTTGSQTRHRFSRRSIFPLLCLSLSCQVAEPSPATVGPNGATPDSDPFIQDLVRKSAEKREERAEQRLNDYYRRNYKEYFEFDVGAAKSRGLSPETEAKIRQWLKDNPS